MLYVSYSLRLFVQMSHRMTNWKGDEPQFWSVRLVKMLIVPFWSRWAGSCGEPQGSYSHRRFSVDPHPPGPHLCKWSTLTHLPKEEWESFNPEFKSPKALDKTNICLHSSWVINNKYFFFYLNHLHQKIIWIIRIFLLFIYLLLDIYLRYNKQSYFLWNIKEDIFRNVSL